MSASSRAVLEHSTPATRARFHDPENFFAFKFAPVPRRQFLSERDRAFDHGTATAEVVLDASDALGTPYHATTPTLLARYLRVHADEQLRITRHASAEVLYVMRGHGSSSGCDERIDWEPGDVFCFPGGREVIHRAARDAVLFSVCNEPLLRFETLEPPRPGQGRVLPVHWSAKEMNRRFEAVFARPATEQTTGRALNLASAQMEPARHPIPSINVAINTLEAGGDQRAHRHNGAAITLSIKGEGVYSMIENERVDWSDGAAQVTPATELHSHHNRGRERMRSLVVQDEGLHFYTRTPGFSWV